MTAFVEFPQDGHEFSANEVGQALAGLVARDTNGLPRVGMLSAPAVMAVPSSWKVEVGRFVYVDHLSGAVQFSGLSAPEQVDIASAAGIPAGQGRIDRIVWDPNTAALSVVQGVVSAAPVAPAIGTKAPAFRVRVDSGDGMVLAAKISRDYAATEVGDAVVVPFTWDTAKVNVIRSALEISGRWARLRFYVSRKTGSWVSGEVLGQVDASYAPEFVEFSPVSVTPVGPVGNVAMRPTGKLELHTVSGTTVLGDFEWPLR